MNAYAASILQGALLTVGVSLAALAVATVLGLLGAVAKLSGRRLGWHGHRLHHPHPGNSRPGADVAHLYGGTMGPQQPAGMAGQRRND